MDCISGFSKFIDIVSKLFSTRGYLKIYLTRLISVENTIFLSQFSEHVFIPEQEVGAYIYLNDNFEPTTPFLSDQKNLSDNC